MDSKELILAADVGGTKTAMSVLNADGFEVGQAQFATEGKAGPVAFAGELAAAFKQQLTSMGLSFDDLSLASMSLAAVCHKVSGGINYQGFNIPALHVEGGVPFTSMLSTELGVAVVGLNDGVAAALGEQGARGGAAFGTQNVIAITIGTGVGGALVVDGRPVFFELIGTDGLRPREDQENRNGPEIGHWRVDQRPDAPTCGCSNDPSKPAIGHLEALFGGRAITSLGLDPAANLSLLAERGLTYLPKVLLPLIVHYRIQKVVIAGGIGTALMDIGFGASLLTALDTPSVMIVKASFDNASLKGAEIFGLMTQNSRSISEEPDLRSTVS